QGEGVAVDPAVAGELVQRPQFAAEFTLPALETESPLPQSEFAAGIGEFVRRCRPGPESDVHDPDPIVIGGGDAQQSVRCRTQPARAHRHATTEPGDAESEPFQRRREYPDVLVAVPATTT